LDADQFRRWAGKIRPNTEGLVTAVLASRPHPEQGFRTCSQSSPPIVASIRLARRRFQSAP
jgi:hypothetical protein